MCIEDLHAVTCLPYIVRLVKSRKMRWASHVARVIEECIRFLWENQNERDQLEDLCMISGFLRELEENRSPLGYYVASSGNSLPTLRDNLSVPFSRVGELFTYEDVTDCLSRNFGKELPLLAA